MAVGPLGHKTDAGGRVVQIYASQSGMPSLAMGPITEVALSVSVGISTKGEATGAAAASPERIEIVVPTVVIADNGKEGRIGRPGTRPKTIAGAAAASVEAGRGRKTGRYQQHHFPITTLTAAGRLVEVGGNVGDRDSGRQASTTGSVDKTTGTRTPRWSKRKLNGNTETEVNVLLKAETETPVLGVPKAIIAGRVGMGRVGQV